MGKERIVRLYGKDRAPHVHRGAILYLNEDNRTPEGVYVKEEEIAEILEESEVSKAQSKSNGKPKLCDIDMWLDLQFLLEMVEAMKVPVETLKKYPKNNWKKGAGD